LAKIVTVEQMRAIERAADASGLSYDQMMENAGQAVADAILRRWPEIAGWRAVILVGPGNNGGDGLVVGYHLMQAGTQVVIYLTSERSEQDDANLARIVEGGALVVRAEEDHRWRLLRKSLESADLVVDALLGTGARPPLRGVIKEVLGLTRKTIEQRRTRPVIVAVDCPSGLDCDTGEIDDLHLAADLTVTLAAAKPGLFKFPAAEAVGALEVGDIGIPEDLEPYREVSLELATPEVVKAWLPRRPRNAHKGTFGRIVIVAGSANFPGAAGLAGMGAYRAGAGLVTLAVPTPIQSQLVALLPEHELGVFEEAAAEVLRRQLGHANAMLLGPGFGLEKPTREFLKALLTGDGTEGRGRLGFIHEDEGGPEVHLPPCVVDADGLKLLVDIEDPTPGRICHHDGAFDPGNSERSRGKGSRICRQVGTCSGSQRGVQRGCGARRQGRGGAVCHAGACASWHGRCPGGGDRSLAGAGSRTLRSCSPWSVPAWPGGRIGRGPPGNGGQRSGGRRSRGIGGSHRRIRDLSPRSGCWK